MVIVNNAKCVVHPFFRTKRCAHQLAIKYLHFLSGKFIIRLKNIKIVKTQGCGSRPALIQILEKKKNPDPSVNNGIEYFFEKKKSWIRITWVTLVNLYWKKSFFKRNFDVQNQPVFRVRIRAFSILESGTVD